MKDLPVKPKTKSFSSKYLSFKLKKAVVEPAPVYVEPSTDNYDHIQDLI